MKVHNKSLLTLSLALILLTFASCEKVKQQVQETVASFPSGNSSLQRLNYTWYITKSGATFVEAKSEQNGAISSMKLVKK